MAHVAVRAKIVTDNTGYVAQIPVILTEFGPLTPLIDYLMQHRHVRSNSTFNKLVQGIGLLLDYMEANHDCFENPEELFNGFVKRLYSGTVSLDGTDPSGLYWNGRSPEVVRQMVIQVSNFSDWMEERLGTQPLNPWRQATRAEERLAWAAWYHKKKRSFLGHTMARDAAAAEMTRARNTLLKMSPVVNHSGVKYFPEERIHDLLFRGFIVPGKQKSPRLEERLNLRDMLITMLLHYGGVRMSEPFHLFVHDVRTDPQNPRRAWVRVYEPSQGEAPNDWLDAKGSPTRCDRNTYLRAKWGLMPRTEYPSSHQWHAGWKNNLIERNGKFMEVHWFPSWAGELFWKLWVFYMAQRAQLVCDHPFAFVTLEGKPYGIDSYQRAYTTAVKRIGLTASKSLGTSPHAHRHAYGQRLTDYGIDPIFRKKALHHKSLESQTVYTEPDRIKLNRALESAIQREAEDGSLPPPDFLAYGFEDIDPLGLMSGRNPKLLRRK